MSNKGKGPIYGIELIESLPIPEAGLMRQAMPSRNDLQLSRSNGDRLAAGYEVLLCHYQRQHNLLVELRDEFQRQGWTQTAAKIDAVIVD